MADGDVFTIDRISWDFFRIIGTQMRCNLVSKKVEVNPRFGRSAHCATEKSFVEVARGCQIRYWKGEVKRSDTHVDCDRVTKS